MPCSWPGADIRKSSTGWVWHHDVGADVMQLVPKSQLSEVYFGILCIRMELAVCNWGK
jgi:hypothetical protein